MKIIIFFLMFLYVAQEAFAQEVPKKELTKISMKAAGSLTVSYHAGSESVFLNFSGPGIRVDYGKFGISYHMFPSLRYFHGDTEDSNNLYRTKAEVTPILGTGFQLNYKKFAIVLPFYYLPSNNVWFLSIGAGYKL